MPTGTGTIEAASGEGLRDNSENLAVASNDARRDCVPEEHRKPVEAATAETEVVVKAGSADILEHARNG